jgi:hypothetical protein
VAYSGLPLILYGGQIKGENGGGKKRMKLFSVHFNVQTPIRIVFLNNFANGRSPLKMKPCTGGGPKIGKKKPGEL